MTTVGIRELKAKLSKYVKRVQSGEVVQVTDRGRVVAELRPPTPKRKFPPELAGLQDLIDEGIVREPAPNSPSLYKRSRLRCPDGTVEKLIDELREDR
jgi:antitoxin (DNA-binding transcriptional repressor) of toxin-antitoxin stability system